MLPENRSYRNGAVTGTAEAVQWFFDTKLSYTVAKYCYLAREIAIQDFVNPKYFSQNNANDCEAILLASHPTTSTPFEPTRSETGKTSPT
jgi:hypothetical protein